MKKKILLTLLILTINIAYGQKVERNMVLVEIHTGVYCCACPAAARGADELIANGDPVAIIEYHNFTHNDPFFQSQFKSRMRFYNVYGWPTAYFDGTDSVVGGWIDSTNYYDYYPKVYERIEDSSSFTIDIKIWQYPNSDTTFTVSVIVTKVADYPQDTLHVMLVLAESHIPYQWGQTDITEMNFVARDMIPDTVGTSAVFELNTPEKFQYRIDVPLDYVIENCELVAFVQNFKTKEVVQTQKANIAQTVGIIQKSNIQKVLLYPNPTTENITVESEITINGINIYDMNGRLVKEINCNSRIVCMDISYLKSGLYNITVKTDKGYSKHLLVVK